MAELGIYARLQEAAAHTGICFILVTPDGERTMNTSLGASCLFDQGLVSDEDIARAKIFHFAAYQWANPGQKRAVKRAMEVAKAHETLVSFDLADPFVVKENQKDLIELIENYADLVFCNREEARLLYDTTPEMSCTRITEAGAIAAVKLGSEGALVGQGPRRIPIAPVPTKVVDTTAAGDMFAAGFLHGYVHGRSLENCGHIGAFLASDVISRLGATVSQEALRHVAKI